MQYKVAVKSINDFNDREIAQFKNLHDAQLFIQIKLRKDAEQKVTLIYMIKEFGETVETFDPRSIPADSATSSAASTSQQGTAGQGARPSPFATSPAPAGAAKKWWTDPDEEKK